MLETVTAADLNALLEPGDGPCVSVYVDGGEPDRDAEQTRIKFKDRIREAAASLGVDPDTTAEGSEQHPLIAGLRGAIGSESLWPGQREGLCVFASPDRLIVRRTPERVPDLAVVADSFHVRPLIRIVNDTRRLRLLCVSAERVAMFDSDGRTLSPIALHGSVPTSIHEALGGAVDLPEAEREAYDLTGAGLLQSEQRPAILKRFFDRLDASIAEHHRPDAGVPLVLAALPEYHGVFHDAVTRLTPVEEGIKRDPFKDITEDELAALAADAVAGDREQTAQELREAYGAAAAHEQGSDDLGQIAQAAAFGRVDLLMLERGQRIGGAVDRDTGELTRKGLDDPATDDVLDDIAELVLRADGRVRVLPTGAMPSDQPAAAVFRYAA